MATLADEEQSTSAQEQVLSSPQGGPPTPQSGLSGLERIVATQLINRIKEAQTGQPTRATAAEGERMSIRLRLQEDGELIHIMVNPFEAALIGELLQSPDKPMNIEAAIISPTQTWLITWQELGARTPGQALVISAIWKMALKEGH